MLTILDEYTRECLTIHVARSISSRQVIQRAGMARSAARRTRPSAQRQRSGIHRLRPSAVAARSAVQHAVHQARQSVGKPVHREFQRYVSQLNVSIAGSLSMVMRPRSSSNIGGRSTIIVVRTAASATWLRLSLQNRLDSHSTWSRSWGQISSFSEFVPKFVKPRLGYSMPCFHPPAVLAGSSSGFRPGS